MGRTYHQGQRAAAVEITRARIIAAAQELLLGGQAMSVSMEEVARRAGVSRQTVYQHFRSRSDLYVAMLNQVLEGAEVKGFVSAIQVQDPLVAFRRGIAGACRLWASRREAFKQITVLCEIDAGVAELNQRREELRSGYIEFVIQRLDAAGLLRPDMTPDDAILAVEVATRFASFDYLYTARKLSLAKITTLLTAVLERAILREDIIAAATEGEGAEADV